MMTYLGAAAASLAVLGMVLSVGSWHVVPEGYVGVFYRFGRMLDESTIASAGLHFMLPPPITSVTNVYVMPQVDSVKDVKCGTKDGTSIEFPSIEVGNTLPREHAFDVVKTYGSEYDQFLIFKQVEYITNGLCSQYSSHELAIEKFNDLDDWVKEELESIQSELKTGLKIGFVRIAKPRLPEALSKAYQRQAAERALKKAKEEEFLRIEQENLNDELKVKGAAQRKLIQAQNANDIELEKFKSKQLQSQIENEIVVSKSTAKFEALKNEALGNQLLLTKEYLELKRFEALTKNAKMIIGNEIPANAFINGLAQFQALDLSPDDSE